MSDGPTILAFPAGPLACNCSIVADPERREAVIIDPGGDEARITELLRDRGLRVQAILHTHAHLDHLGATGPVREACQAPVYLHPDDDFLWRNVPTQAQLIGLPVFQPPAVDQPLAHDQEIPIGRYRLRVVHTPGHSPGSVCFRLTGPDSPEPIRLFSGDTLFRLSVGRTDLWGGSWDQLLGSIHDHLLVLPDPTQVVPGHGPMTTIGTERDRNPFIAGGADPNAGSF